MKEKLNSFHVALLIYMIELDVSVFILPRLVAIELGTNGWLGFLGLSLLAMFNIWLYRIVYRAGRGASMFDIIEGALPKAVAYPFYVLLALLWLGIGSFAGKTFVLVFQTLTFQNTSSMFIFIGYCLLVYALLSKDLYSIVKAATVFFLLSIWILLLAPYFFKDWSLYRFTSFFFQGTMNGHSLSGVLNVYTAFIGYELCLLLFPYTDAKSKLFKGVFAGHMLMTAVQLLTIFISFGFFSFEEVKVIEYPVLQTLEFIELPFINRVENMVYPFFLFSNIVTTTMFAFAALSAVGRIAPKADRRLLAACLTAVIFVLGFLPSSFRQASIWMRLVYYAETGVAFALPLLLYALLKLRKSHKVHEGGRDVEGDRLDRAHQCQEPRQHPGCSAAERAAGPRRQGRRRAHDPRLAAGVRRLAAAEQHAGTAGAGARDGEVRQRALRDADPHDAKSGVGCDRRRQPRPRADELCRLEVAELAARLRRGRHLGKSKSVDQRFRQADRILTRRHGL